MPPTGGQPKPPCCQDERRPRNALQISKSSRSHVTSATRTLAGRIGEGYVRRRQAMHKTRIGNSHVGLATCSCIKLRTDLWAWHLRYAWGLSKPKKYFHQRDSVNKKRGGKLKVDKKPFIKPKGCQTSQVAYMQTTLVHQGKIIAAHRRSINTFLIVRHSTTRSVWRFMLSTYQSVVRRVSIPMMSYNDT